MIWQSKEGLPKLRAPRKIAHQRPGNKKDVLGGGRREQAVRRDGRNQELVKPPDDNLNLLSPLLPRAVPDKVAHVPPRAHEVARVVCAVGKRGPDAEAAFTSVAAGAIRYVIIEAGAV